MDGIEKAERDTAFDDEDAYRSGGIRLLYDSLTEPIQGVKSGILLEAGFDTATPNKELTISSWALDYALEREVPGIINNQAMAIACYHPGYTFVEKLQTIVTKFRKEQEGAAKQLNYMRQYYDIYCLLNHPEVQSFIGSAEYEAHKQSGFQKQIYSFQFQKMKRFYCLIVSSVQTLQNAMKQQRTFIIKGNLPSRKYLLGSGII